MSIVSLKTLLGHSQGALSPGIRKPRAYLGIVLQVQKPQVKEQDVETYM